MLHQNHIKMAKRASRVSYDQKVLLVTFMEEHLSLAHNQSDPERRQALWDQLVIQLNGQPEGTTKTLPQWQVCWKTLKTHTKAKSVGRRLRDGLTDLEERVLAILGRTLFLRQDNTPELGFEPVCPVGPDPLKNEAADSTGSESSGIELEESVKTEPATPPPSPIGIVNIQDELEHVGLITPGRRGKSKAPADSEEEGESKKCKLLAEISINMGQIAASTAEMVKHMARIAAAIEKLANK